MLAKPYKSALKYGPVLGNFWNRIDWPKQDFPGIYTCSIDDRLDTIFDTIRKSRVHRLIVIDEDNRLVGILTLSDILEYILLEGESEDAKPV